MAYVSQELKAKIAPTVKAILKRYGVKGTLAVNNHSTLVLNIKSGNIDFIGNYNSVQETNLDTYSYARKHVAENNIDVNVYHFDKHFSGVAKEFLMEVHAAMMAGNWDKSDIQSDYFNVGWYTDINIGKWNKPYILTRE